MSETSHVYPTYVPSESLVQDLKDFICRNDERLTKFNNAVETAVEDAPRDMGAEGISTLDNFLQYCDDLLRWVPKVSSTGDEMLRKILVFYWVIDQPEVRDLQTPISPENSNTDLNWLSYWLVCFARQQGQYLSTPESAAAVYTFYINDKYNKEAKKWEEPKDGWLSFNHWFARRWKNINRARPVASPNNPNVIVHPADSIYDGSWPIENGIVEIKIKGVEISWPIKDLLRVQDNDTTWNQGQFMHAFLGPSDYHRQHSPVTGKVVEVRKIQNQVYLQVAQKQGEDTIFADRAILRAPEEVERRKGARIQSNEDLDAPDEAGYQWCQTRGLIIIDTAGYGNHGKVAILPIGMAHVSSVVMCVNKDDVVKKGDTISYFQFGGSDCVVVFEKQVRFREDLVPGKTKILVREKLATFE
ncbi:unnamed protein product [Penicillium egyptiacum]|uniref:Phosphatidylserine decarboxylase n=1 Tax=Penicillium egyptiacum TaxID=1303716 RepID=A0A9W4P886_9EURO|nr:unnamed protein product [Penicillium egyptiacum]